VAKPEFGTKRICPVTNKKFYDLNKDPVVSPYTGESYPRAYFEPVAAPARSMAKMASVSAAVAAVVPDEVEGEEPEGAELVALEEADGDADAAKVDLAEDIEIEDDGAGEDDTFLEDEEDEDDDVTDLIGDGIEDDEEG
jgi:uncharacterized protein (TIGR02300 family)